MELLVKKAKRGDAEAFIELIEQNKLSMYRVAHGFLKEEEDVADAMSETVLTCYEKVGSLRQDAYFKTWMIRILINNCKDILKRQKRNILTEDIPEQAQREMMQNLVDTLEGMPDALDSFDEGSWYALVDHATVYGRDDVRFTFKNGMEIKA